MDVQAQRVVPIVFALTYQHLVHDSLTYKGNEKALHLRVTGPIPL